MADHQSIFHKKQIEVVFFVCFFSLSLFISLNVFSVVSYRNIASADSKFY